MHHFVWRTRSAHPNQYGGASISLVLNSGFRIMSDATVASHNAISINYLLFVFRNGVRILDSIASGLFVRSCGSCCCCRHLSFDACIAFLSIDYAIAVDETGSHKSS